MNDSCFWPSSVEYWIGLAVLVTARGLDFLSTWVVTPRLTLEANPLVRWMSWRWSAVVNLLACAGAATMPFVVVIVSVTSGLVAARNFQSAWLARAMGEDDYRRMLHDQMARADSRVVFGSVWARAIIYAAIGGVLVVWTTDPLALAVGWGIIGFALAVAIYSTWSFLRARHALSNED